MRELTNNEKISLIKKYYKKNPILLELCLFNYEEFNLYICISLINKSNCYRLSWFNLDEINDKNIDKKLSCQYIPQETIEIIKENFLKYYESSKYHDDFLTDEYTVILKANLKTEVDDNIDVSFKKYLPHEVSHLMKLIVFIFKNMPKKYEELLFEILAGITNTIERYEYKKEFDFDLFNGDIDKLFNYQICQRGKKYYDESKVKFLEKINDRYFATVEGTVKYLTIIKYNEEEKKMQVYCSCPCEFYCKHMYAVILSIRNKKFCNFYKITYKNPNESFYERIMDFEYLLCTGIVEQYLEIINNYGEFELVPIINNNGNCNWQVLEDSKNEELTKQIKKLINS